MADVRPGSETHDSHLYRGRLAPSPTGLLHIGHAQTFWIAQQRAREHNGKLVLRIEDLDSARSKSEFGEAVFQDLKWFGFHWDEGPDCGGPFVPYVQSARHVLYQAAFESLKRTGAIYPCTCSRQDVLRALHAPHFGEEEPLYPGTCRPPALLNRKSSRINWRFRVSDGEAIRFSDGRCGPQEFVAGRHFGDFIVWRHDNVPSYQLAVVVDDSAMKITEVVRGEDLLLSTARQLVLYRALGLQPPAFYHCPLVHDETGARLAKRHDSLSFRALRASGVSPEQLRAKWDLKIR